MVSAALCFLKAASLKMAPTAGTMWKIHSKDEENTFQGCRASDYSRPTTSSSGHGLLMISSKKHREDELSPRENKWLAPGYRADENRVSAKT